VAKRYKMKKYQLNKEITNIDVPLYEIWEDNIEDKISIRTMVKSLGEPFKTAIFLRYSEELDYKEIANIMNTTTGQIKNYLFRAKKSIMKSWKNKTI
jgi:RNA polymerase sigma factor (sigma-70 family)